MVKDSEYRARVAQELWETEKHYVNYLDLFVKSFLYPLREDANRSEKPMLSVENIKNVFSSIEIIVGTNKILLQDINAALENWSINQKLGHIMKYMTKYLRVYTDYITNYDFALRKFSDLRKNNKKLDATVQEIETASCFNGLSFSSLLIMPVQRIPRYNMLLQDILKHTWEFHPDYQDLYDVTQEIGATADYLNSKKAESESIFKVQELEDSITGLKIDNFAVHTRRYVDDFACVLVLFKGEKSGKFYILNDMVIIVATKNNKEKFIACYVLDECDIYLENQQIVFDNGENKTAIINNTGHGVDGWFHQIELAKQDHIERLASLQREKVEEQFVPVPVNTSTTGTPKAKIMKKLALSSLKPKKLKRDRAKSPRKSNILENIDLTDDEKEKRRVLLESIKNYNRY
eukprot:TRINITY_DN1590_c0_g1_i3.p1 TRINITY_DN1590_c0_g1~~TRINITY_DN1590_c0_g1_i3.p1  ORF type:complete len:405 (+),score=79.36 TRINITY_DN1590_c0_g1_i3:1107-2321(+)